MSAFPPWQPHPEVWLLVAGLIALGLYATRVIQPTVVAKGGKAVTTAQKRWFVSGVALLWIASDWPMHNVGEERLYSVHMIQHLLFTLVIAPMLLLATPEWLGRLILGQGRVNRVFRRLARPIPAALAYNVVVLLTHAAPVVNNSIKYGPLHYTVHAFVIGTALLVWTPICGPFPELRSTPPVQMVSVFGLSIIPTIPSAFLTAADNVIYRGYDHGPRLWGITALQDQEAAGAIMKIAGGFYLWGIIIVMFFRWMNKENDPKGFRGKLVTKVEPKPTEPVTVPSGTATTPTPEAAPPTR